MYFSPTTWRITLSDNTVGTNARERENAGSHSTEYYVLINKHLG